MQRLPILGAACLALGALGSAPAFAQGSPAAGGAVPTSRWGAADEIGAANLLSPAKVIEAAKLIRDGKTYRLGIQVDRSTPAFPPRSLAVTIMMPNQFEGAVVPSDNGMSYVDDMITGWLGVGTQLDSLAHLGIDNVFYNGNHAKDFVQTTGVTKLGIEKIPPFVTRAVVLDLAKAKGKPRLDGGELVTADELRAAMAAQNVRVTPGDVIILHTGWLSMLKENAAKFGSEEPGIDGAGAEYLASLQPLAIGADTWGIEAVPFKNPKIVWQGHQILLARNGIYILENLDTSRLIADGVTECMFVLGQPLYTGAVQSIINPVAIR